MIDAALSPLPRTSPAQDSGVPGRAALSVLILAKDEEAVIARAIASVAWADEILVLDSGSTDRTVEIARSLGARVEQQPWLGWLQQHLRAVELARHDWVLSLDADEIVTPVLGRSIRQALAAGPDPRDGYVVERAEEFLGRIMPNMRRRKKRLSFVRLFNRRYSNWDPELIIHEEVRPAGRTVPLEGLLLHWRNYTLAEQMATLNRNSDLEAQLLDRRPTRLRAVMVVVKPLLRFGWIYLLCGSWRLGLRGFIWSALHSGGEFLRQAKAWEIRHAPRMPDPPPELCRNASAAGSDQVPFRQ